MWAKQGTLLNYMVVDWCVVTSRPLTILSEFFQNCKELELLRLVYYGGVQHEIRKEVWPFLLGHYKFGMGKKDMTQVKQIPEFSFIRRTCELFLQAALAAGLNALLSTD